MTNITKLPHYQWTVMHGFWSRMTLKMGTPGPSSFLFHSLSFYHTQSDARTHEGRPSKSKQGHLSWSSAVWRQTREFTRSPAWCPWWLGDVRAITVTETTEKFTMDAMRQLQPQVLIPAQVTISDLKANPHMKTHFQKLHLPVES